jgi:hypothetical protein
VLYRVFPFRAGVAPNDDGGALFVARHLQGQGRHDNPRQYGAIYASRDAVSSVAELLARFRGQIMTDGDLRRADGKRYALAVIDDAPLGALLDLDDPAELASRGLRPSVVATMNRETTQEMALGIFEEGRAGFAWWSALEASWANVTLFAEGAAPMLVVPEVPLELSVTLPVVQAAAAVLGVGLG